MKNKYLLQQNYLKNLIDFNSLTGNKENMFCFNKNESKEHLKKKLEICGKLLDLGFTFYTEVKFKNNLGRADIIAFNTNGDGFIIEVVKTESEKSKIQKINKYPIEFSLIFVNVNEDINDLKI